MKKLLAIISILMLVNMVAVSAGTFTTYVITETSDGVVSEIVGVADNQAEEIPVDGEEVIPDEEPVEEIPDETETDEEQVDETDGVPVEDPEECVIPTDGMKINESTTFCTGDYDLPNGIEIGADNIILDCNDAYLYGTGTYGIELSYRDNVEIKNCNVVGYDFVGIFLGYSNNNVIMNSYAGNTSSYGIYLYKSDYNNISNNGMSYNYHGLNMYGSDNNYIWSNNARHNSNDGFQIYKSRYNHFESNEGTDNEDNGYEFSGDDLYNDIDNNIAVENGHDGFEIIWGSNYNTFEENTASNNGNRGFVFYGDIIGNELYDNTAIDNEGVGFELYFSSSEHVLEDNLATGNGEGFEILSSSEGNSSDHTFEYNTAEENDYNGFTINGGTDIALRYNTIINNNVGINFAGDIDNIDVYKNDIYSNTYNIYNMQSSDIPAENNYWGTDVESEISDGIFDGEDYSEYGVVDHCPYLDGSYPDGESVSCDGEVIRSIVELTGEFSDYGYEVGDLYRYLIIDAGIEVFNEGSYKIEGILTDSEGNEYESSNIFSEATYEEGEQTAELRFYGEDIYENGVDGPYYLSNVEISSCYDISEENRISVETEDNTLNYGESIADVIDVIDDDEFPYMLQVETFEDDIGENVNVEDYTQEIAFSGGAQELVYLQRNGDAPEAGSYLHLDDSYGDYAYTYYVYFDDAIHYDNSGDDAAREDLIGAELELQDINFEITNVTLADGKIDELHLNAEDAFYWFEEGIAYTKIVDGIEHEIEIIDSDEEEEKCGISVDGTAEWIGDADSAIINGVYVYISRVETIHSATQDTDFCRVGFGELDLVLDNKDEIETDGADIDGSYFEVYETVGGEIEGFEIKYTVEDDIYLPEYGRWIDPIFGNLMISMEYMMDKTEEIEFDVNIDKAYLSFETIDDGHIEVPYHYEEYDSLLGSSSDVDDGFYVNNFSIELDYVGDAEGIEILKQGSNGVCEVYRLKDIDTTSKLTFEDLTTGGEKTNYYAEDNYTTIDVFGELLDVYIDEDNRLTIDQVDEYEGGCVTSFGGGIIVGGDGFTLVEDDNYDGDGSETSTSIYFGLVRNVTSSELYIEEPEFFDDSYYGPYDEDETDEETQHYMTLYGTEIEYIPGFVNIEYPTEEVYGKVYITNLGEKPTYETECIVIDSMEDAYTTSSYSYDEFEHEENEAPEVSIIAPTSVKAGVSNNYTFIAEDDDGAIESIAIHWGDGYTTVDDVNESYMKIVYSYIYEEAGTYTINFEADDDDGATSSITIEVVVSEDNPPELTIISPAMVYSGIEYNWTFMAEDDNQLTSYDIEWGDGDWIHGTLNYADFSKTYSHAYDSEGTYTLYFEATDNDNETSSMSIEVEVKEAKNNAPTVEITSLESRETVSGKVEISGTASDADGIEELQGSTTSDGMTFEDGVWISFNYDDDVMSSTWIFASDVSDDGSWSYEWDTTEFDDSKITVAVVAFDGDWDVDFNVDEVGVVIDNENDAPTVTIDSPSDGDSVSGKITVSGTASDADGDDELSGSTEGYSHGTYISFDYVDDVGSATWIHTDEGTSWDYEFDTTEVADGELVITAIAFDGVWGG